MAGLDHVNRGEFQELLRQVRQLATQSPLGNSAIDRGSLRILSAEGLIVEGSQRVSGTLLVSGTETVDGVLNVTGTLVVAGNASIAGPTSIDGSLGINGPASINGSLEINGPTVVTGTFGVDGNTTITGSVSLTGELDVDGGGRIRVGGMTLDPSSNGGSLTFAGGPEVYASGGTLALYSTTSGAFIELGGVAKLNGPGARWVEVNGTGIRLAGLPTAAASAYPGSFPGAVVADSSGNLRRIV